MAQPPSTLVREVTYIGHNPHDWKLIKVWDSKIWRYDNYLNTIRNLPQYDLVCGKGIVAVDDLPGYGFKS